jgi:hypothetical protein
MPPGWGLMMPGGRGRRFKVLVKPAEREPRLTVALLLTLLKSTETTRTNALLKIRQDTSHAAYQREQELRKELAGKADPEVRKRLALLDQVEQHLGIPLSTYSWEDDRITPETAAAALKEYAAGAAALAHAKDELTRRAHDLDSLSIDIARRSRALRDAIGSTEKQQPVAATIANREA